MNAVWQVGASLGVVVLRSTRCRIPGGETHSWRWYAIPSLMALLGIGIHSVASAQPPEATKFLMRNVTRSTQMPLSYRTPPGFWESVDSDPTSVDAIVERLLVAHSLNLYDGALWQICMARTGNTDRSDSHTVRLASGRSGDLATIKASRPPFVYGDRRVSLSSRHAFFFRMISDEYLQRDPLDGKTRFGGFPTWPDLHHEDWMPITGENAWIVIGCLQTAFLKYGGKIPMNATEVEIALDLVPAFEAMQSPIGGIYHAPYGTYGKEPNEISNENNISARSALIQIRQAILLAKDHDPRGYDRVSSYLKRIDALVSGIDHYFKDHSYDRVGGVFYQGGVYANGAFTPSRDFAVDCQTWMIAADHVSTIDRWFGDGTAYKVWTETKRRAGYSANGKLRGVGFTDGHDVLSGEWTAGAILAVLKAAAGYETSHSDWSLELRRDAVAMRRGVEGLKASLSDGSVAYLYSNKRTRIPFGWWGNPIPSVASTVWIASFLDGIPTRGVDTVFDPFVLGGTTHLKSTGLRVTCD